MKIHRLAQDVANKIAAGEVVERPASCVKELVENSIDAGAKEISVEIASGGLEMIRVSDNGCGMDREDAILAFERHATSKITGADDLFRITSLGFRGEALPSIASVSKVTLTTCAQGDDVGSLIELSGGEIVQISDVGAPVGTTIEVGELFFNTPARLKYLSSSRAETRRVIDTMSKLALARPDVSLRLRVDDRLMFSTSGSGDLVDAAAQVMGTEVARKMIPVSKEIDGMSISGLIAHPEKAKSGRDDQYFSVNGRPFVSKTAWVASDRAADSLIPAGKHLPLVFMVEVDPSTVDVNVHPTKSEVRFSDDKQFYSLVYGAVTSALRSYDVMPDFELSEGERDGMKPDKAPNEVQQRIYMGDGYGSAVYQTASSQPDPKFNDMRTMFEDVGAVEEDTFKTPIFKPSAVNDYKVDWSEMVREERQREDEYRARQEPRSGREGNIDVSSFRIIGQLANTYILVQHSGGLLIVDQHVAHERVLVDLFRKRAEERAVEVQLLLAPQLVDLTPRLCTTALEYVDQLEKMGFQFDQLSGNSMLLRGVPMIPGTSTSPDEMFRETVCGLEDVPKGSEDRVIYDKIVVTASCKAAVKAGMPLEPDMMSKLMKDLFRTSAPFNCPHGRPIILNLSYEKLGRSFKRI